MDFKNFSVNIYVLSSLICMVGQFLDVTGFWIVSGLLYKLNKQLSPRQLVNS